MKKNFTLLEMLAVIAIIAILAGLLMPAINKARAKSRTTNCLSNQNQTAKSISMYINDTKGKLSCGNDVDNSWAYHLYAKDYIQQDMKAYRCTALQYPSDSATNVGKTSFDGYKYAYGVAYTTATGGLFDFSGTRYFRDGSIRIAPSALVLGGCAAKKGTSDGLAVMDFSGSSTTLGVPVGIHDDACNFFFFDGHAVTQRKGEACHAYYPSTDSSASSQKAVVFNPDKIQSL